jgi:hypothetical protein
MSQIKLKKKCKSDLDFEDLMNKDKFWVTNLSHFCLNLKNYSKEY